MWSIPDQLDPNCPSNAVDWNHEKCPVRSRLSKSPIQQLGNSTEPSRLERALKHSGRSLSRPGERVAPSGSLDSSSRPLYDQRAYRALRLACLFIKSWTRQPKPLCRVRWLAKRAIIDEQRAEKSRTAPSILWTDIDWRADRGEDQRSQVEAKQWHQAMWQRDHRACKTHQDTGFQKVPLEVDQRHQGRPNPEESYRTQSWTCSLAQCSHG